MLVRECMTKNPVTVAPSDALAVAQGKLRAGGFRRLPVLHEGKLIGILSEYDLRRYPESLDSTLVVTAMTLNPVAVSATATVETRSSVAQKK